jgi:hypothetical protein
MKKAEIIKNGNVNLKPIKTGIDWDEIKIDFLVWRGKYFFKSGFDPSSFLITRWFKKRIEKELQASGPNP